MLRPVKRTKMFHTKHFGTNRPRNWTNRATNTAATTMRLVNSIALVRRLDGEARSAATGRRRRRVDDFEHSAHHIVDEVDP